MEDTRYDKGDSPYFKFTQETYTFITDTWSYSDPDSGYPKITITDPTGSIKINAVLMTKKMVGKYEYIYALELTAASGWWTGFIDVMNAAYPDRKTFGFEVK